jgi:hypothetical protein
LYPHPTATRRCIVRVLVSFLLCCGFVSTVLAADNSGTAVVSPFEVTVSARQVAMGDAFCALGNDVNSMLFNPATLSFLSRYTISFSHNRWFMDTYQSYVAYGAQTKFGVFGVGLMYFNQGKFQVWKDGTPTDETKGVYDIGIALGYASEYFDAVSIGFVAKFLHYDWGGYMASAIAGDVGILGPKISLLNAEDSVSFGLAVQNFGSKVKFVNDAFSQPLNVKVGIAYSIDNISFTGIPYFDCRLAIDANYPKDSNIRVNIGTEVWVKDVLALRFGFRPTGYDFNDSKLSMGCGLKVKDFYIDYAYVDYGDLLGTAAHRLSGTVHVW